MIKAKNIISDKGNPITNQIIITDSKKDSETFQSYDSIIAIKENALNAHRNRKRVYQSQNEEINSIKSEVNEIKDMLRQLLDRK